MNNESMNNESMNNESMNNESMNNESMNNESMNNESMNNESMNNESMNNESMNNESMNNESINDSDKLEELFECLKPYINTFKQSTYLDKANRLRYKKNFELRTLHIFNDNGDLFNKFRKFLKDKLTTKWLYTGYALSYAGRIPPNDYHRIELARYMIPYKKNILQSSLSKYIFHQVISRLTYVNIVFLDLKFNKLDIDLLKLCVDFNPVYIILYGSKMNKEFHEFLINDYSLFNHISLMVYIKKEFDSTPINNFIH